MEMKIDINCKVHWRKSPEGCEVTDVTLKDKSILKELGHRELQELSDYARHFCELQKSADSGVEEFPLDGIEVDVDFHATKGTEARFSSNFGNWLPGEPPEISIKHVHLGSLDIFNLLPSKTIDRIEMECIERSIAMGESNVSKRYRSSIEKVEKRLDKITHGGKMKSKLGKKEKSVIPGFSYWFKK